MTKSYHGKTRRLSLYKMSTLKKDFKKPKYKNRERGFETILRRCKCELRKSKVEGNGRMALEKATIRVFPPPHLPPIRVFKYLKVVVGEGEHSGPWKN